MHGTALLKGAVGTLLLCAISIALGLSLGSQVPGSPGEFPAATTLAGGGLGLLLSAGVSIYFFGWQSVLGAYAITFFVYRFLYFSSQERGA